MVVEMASEFPPKMNNAARKKKQPRPTAIAPLDVTHLTKTFCDANHLDKKVVIDEINVFEVEQQQQEASKNSPFVRMKKYFCTNRKRRRKMLILLSVAVLFFSLGFSVPHILAAFNKGEKTQNSILFDSQSAAKRPPTKTNAGDLLNDVFISVKTTQKYHHPRLVILLQTWVSLVKEQTYFFTDNNNEDFSSSGMLQGHLIDTNCSSSHSRAALSCKMAKEYDTFLASMVRMHNLWLILGR